MSEHREVVFDLFLQRHIVPKEDWLEECLEFLNSHQLLVGKQSCQVFSAVFEQWKHSDLRDSTYANIEQIGFDFSGKKSTLCGPLIVQVLNLVDIGTPFHTQFKKLTYEFVDNSGFEALPDQIEKNSWEEHPRRCILMEVSDGSQKLRLLEYHKIPFISLLTPPGSKILLLPGLTCRRGIIMLESSLCQLIGGDCEKWEDGRPVQTMAKKLNVDLLNEKAKNICLSHSSTVASTQSSSLSTVTKTSGQSLSRVPNNLCLTAGMLSFDESHTVSSRDVSSVDIDQKNSLLVGDDFDNERAPVRSTNFIKDCKNFVEEGLTDQNDIPERLPQNHIIERLSTSSRRLKPVAKTVPSKSRLSRTGFLLSLRTNSNEDTLSYKSTQEYEPRRRLSANCHNEIHVCLPHQGTNSPPPKRSREFMGNLITKVKDEPMEIINLDDSFTQSTNFTNLSEALGAEMKREDCLQKRELEIHRKEEQLKQRETNVIKFEEHVRKELEESRLRIEVPQTIAEICSNTNTKKENLFITEFKKLKVVRLSDVISQMRFAVGSSRRYVQAIIIDIIEPFRVVDDLWTQKVALADDSLNKPLNCFIHNDVLTELLGMSPAEAIAVAQSKDNERQKEGKRKLDALQESMYRLDLIFQIEFFSQNRAVPVVREIKTLSQMIMDI